MILRNVHHSSVAGTVACRPLEAKCVLANQIAEEKKSMQVDKATSNVAVPLLKCTNGSHGLRFFLIGWNNYCNTKGNYSVPDRLTAVSFQTHLHKINHHFAEAKQDFYVIGRDCLMITISQNYLFSLKSVSFSSSFFVSYPVVTFGKFLTQQIQEFLGIHIPQWVTPHEVKIKLRSKSNVSYYPHSPTQKPPKRRA